MHLQDQDVSNPYLKKERILYKSFLTEKFIYVLAFRYIRSKNLYDVLICH